MSDDQATDDQTATDEASRDQATEIKPRKVGLLLGAGIFFLPIVFAWFTLRKGHSKLARVLSLGWLGLGIAIAAINSIGPTNQAPTDSGEAVEQAAAEQPNAQEPPDAPPAEPISALAVVSAHRWSTWNSPCNGALQATYKPDQGQIIFRNGQILQDSNKPNIAYKFTENSDGSFTFDQVVADMLLTDVLVTLMKERISLESETTIKIERISISLSEAAVMDTSIRSANPTDNPEYYQTEQETIYEERCS